jgi:hypothetical protein
MFLRVFPMLVRRTPGEPWLFSGVSVELGVFALIWLL